MVWNDNTRAIQPATNVAGVFVTHSQPSNTMHTIHILYPFSPTIAPSAPWRSSPADAPSRSRSLGAGRFFFSEWSVVRGL